MPQKPDARPSVSSVKLTRLLCVWRTVMRVGRHYSKWYPACFDAAHPSWTAMVELCATKTNVLDYDFRYAQPMRAEDAYRLWADITSGGGSTSSP